MFGWNRVIDKKAFLETVGEDPSFIDTLIELFRKQSKENVQALESAAKKGDAKAVQQAVHDLKNIGRNIASPKLIKHSVKLEALTAEKQLQQVVESVEKTTQMLEKALLELQELRASLASHAG